MLWRPGASNFRPTQLMASAVNAGVATVGHIANAAVSLDGTTLNAAVGLVTDINDPAGTGGWTNIVNLTGGPLMVVPRYDNVNALHFVEMYSAAQGHGIRTQVLIDNVVASDLIIPADVFSYVGSGDIRPLYYDFDTLFGYHPIYCETSFIVRAAREATCYPDEFIKVTAIDFLYGDRR